MNAKHACDKRQRRMGHEWQGPMGHGGRPRCASEAGRGRRRRPRFGWPPAGASSAAGPARVGPARTRGPAFARRCKGVGGGSDGAHGAQRRVGVTSATRTPAPEGNGPWQDVQARRGVAVDLGVPSSRGGYRGARSVLGCRSGPLSPGDAPHNPPGVAPRSQGLLPPGGTGGRGPLGPWEYIIWHGRPMCRVVGDAIVLLPKHAVSLKIGPQIQIQIPPLPPLLYGGTPTYFGAAHASSALCISQDGALRLTYVHRYTGK